ncbi:MAG TPA: transcriptional repressor [Actinomycetaceae bacterium]|nr:transcriptional repressor [Actinomycetaceae bacterium]
MEGQSAHSGTRDGIVAEAAAEFRRRGARMSVPRRAVLEALLAHSGHLTADEVAETVAEREPGVHRSSVYRALEALCGIGMVQHIHLGHGATAFHLTGPGNPHLHAQCRKCGRVIDLPSNLLDAVARRLLEEAYFQLDATHVALSGLCAGCRSN